MFGIKSVHEDGMFLTSRQMGCMLCNSFHEREGQLWIKIFPDKPITKPLEVRMGKVKVQLSIAVVKPGRIMFEVGGSFVSCKRGVTSCGSKASSKN
jgi:large subunit ribosomal protein L16